MSEAINSKGNFEPIHNAHSIEQVLFAIQFEIPLNDTLLSKIRNIALEFKQDGSLPAINDIQGFTINMGQGPIPSQNGFMLYKTRTDGIIEKELRVERNIVTFRTTHYSRWKDIWSEAEKYFSALIPLFCSNSKITGIGLNYFDKFVWSGSIQECRSDALFNRNSKYLCPYIFTNEDLWHVHTGAFIRVNNQTKRLININIDSFDENLNGDTRRVFVIATVITDQFNQINYDPFAFEEDQIIEGIKLKFTDLHSYGKNVLADIINYNMSKRIALIE